MGFDALTDPEERIWSPAGGSSYLQRINTAYGTNTAAYQSAFRDPNADNFVYYRGDSLDNASADILRRYYNFNGCHLLHTPLAEHFGHDIRIVGF